MMNLSENSATADVVKNIEIVQERNKIQNKDEVVFQNDLQENNVGKINLEEECSCKKGNAMDSGEQCSCKKGNPKSPTYVNAIGRIDYAYRPDVELEVLQARIAEGIPSDVTDREGLHRLLSGDLKNQYFYLASEVCWLLKIANMPSYILIPADPRFYDLFVASLAYPPGRPFDLITNQPVIDNIVGEKGPIGKCNSLPLPLLKVDKARTILLEDVRKNVTYIADKAFKSGMGFTQDEYRDSVMSVVNKMIEIVSENEGASDGQRAIAALVFGSASLPTEVAIIQRKEGVILENVIASPTKMIGNSKIVTVVITFKSKDVGYHISQYAIAVDVTNKFPFMVSPFKEYNPPNL